MIVEKLKIGYRIVGTIKSVKGVRNAGHKEGEKIDLSGYNTGGLCGFFYHDIFPYIMMLKFGSSFPANWGRDPDIVELECMERKNAVRIELKRIKD
ncbi:MAG: TIGR04076 family protein [Promethearchaeota archaeon]